MSQYILYIMYLVLCSMKMVPATCHHISNDHIYYRIYVYLATNKYFLYIHISLYVLNIQRQCASMHATVNSSRWKHLIICSCTYVKISISVSTHLPLLLYAFIHMYLLWYVHRKPDLFWYVCIANTYEFIHTCM